MSAERRFMSKKVTRAEENLRRQGDELASARSELLFLQEQTEELFTKNCEMQSISIELNECQQRNSSQQAVITKQDQYIKALEIKLANCSDEYLRQVYQDIANKSNELKELLKTSQTMREEQQRTEMEERERQKEQLKQIASIKQLMEKRATEMQALKAEQARAATLSQNRALTRSADFVMELVCELKQSVFAYFDDQQRQLSALPANAHSFTFIQDPPSSPLPRSPSEALSLKYSRLESRLLDERESRVSCVGSPRGLERRSSLAKSISKSTLRASECELQSSLTEIDQLLRQAKLRLHPST
jgi:hypothetical protein